jgi:ribosomal-protein-serine acetyltransferase
LFQNGFSSVYTIFTTKKDRQAMNLKPFIKIDDELTLHLARPELAEPVFKVVDAQRLYLRQWLPWVDGTTSVEDTQIFIRESMQHNTAGSRLTTFMMVGDEIAGSIGVVHFNKDHKKCEIGYWLREDLQGRGIMTKSCAGFIQHLFKKKDLHRIEILVAGGNRKSRAVPQRLGFTNEGTLRQSLLMYGQYLDVELFALLKNDWEQSEYAQKF